MLATTALLSVYDKTGVTDLAAGLHELGWRLILEWRLAKAIAGPGRRSPTSAERDRLPRPSSATAS